MKKTFITKPFLPSLDDCFSFSKNIWENKVLTNNGPYHKKFEIELAKYLEAPYIIQKILFLLIYPGLDKSIISIILTILNEE